MSNKFTSIAIIGATSGLGEGFVRRFHAQGKTVIATGRRFERLQALQKELKGLEIQQMDVADLPSLPRQASKLLNAFPQIDTVMVMAGIQKSFDFKDPRTSSAESISLEVSTNVTAPMILAQSIVPHLLAQKRPTTFILVSSGLAFVPMPFYPVYCPTKSAIHTFAVVLRAQLTGSSCNVIELAPPYVDTALDTEHREHIIAAQGGPEKVVKPMPLAEYLDKAMEGLSQEGSKELGELKNYYEEDSKFSGVSQLTACNERSNKSFLDAPRMGHDRQFNELTAALPLKATSDGLIAKFFNNDNPAIPINYLLHRQTFMEEYARHFEDPSRTSAVWLGLLFSMLALASCFFEGEERTTPTASSEYAAMAEKLYEQACGCLDIVDTINPQSGIVEFMSVFLHVTSLRRRDNSTQVWLLAGDTVRLAMRMGYHRDPANYGQFTPFEIEMRRRVWQFVSQTDLLYSFQLGLPPVVRSHEYDTLPPQNYHEGQLFVSMTELPPPQPRDIPTEFSYMRSNYSILQVFRLIVEHLNDLRPSYYDDILVLHQKLLATHSSIAPHFRPVADDNQVDDPYFAKRIQLDLFYNKLMCVLHRKFMVQGITQCQFETSTKECLDAALKLLKHQRVLHLRQKATGRQLQWHTFSLSNHDFILAATILCLYLSHSNSGGAAKSRHSEIVEALKLAHSIWAEVCDTSQDALKAFEFLDRVLSQLSRGTSVAATTLEATGGQVQHSRQVNKDALDSAIDFDWEAWDSYFRDMDLPQPAGIP
ncbi:MAG: hypothetical protein Q9217_002753 [Psora testacea]